MGEKKKKQQRETAKIVANGRTYEFVILDTIHGIGVCHQWLSHIGDNLDDITKGCRKVLEESDGELTAVELFKKLISGDEVFTKLRKLLIEVLDVRILFELCSLFLAGAVLDGEKCDDLGFCPMLRSQPHEVYTVLILAVAVNFPDYFPFILERLDTGESLSPK